MKKGLLKFKKILRCLEGRRQLRTALKGESPQKLRKDGRIKIITLNYWDTREKFAKFWKYNASLVEHNFLTWHRNLLKNYFVENHIFLHRVTENRDVRELIKFLEKRYNTIVHEFEMNLDGIDHFHKFNFVAKKSYEILGDKILDFDYVFTIGQDNFLINHWKENIFEIFIRLFEKKTSPFNEKLGHYKKEKYNYISHTISENPDWRHFQHNASLQKGFYKIDRCPYILESVSRAGNLMTAESYLGKGLGEKCLYLKPNPNFYFTEYELKEINGKTTSTLLEIARNKEKTKEVIEKIKYTLYASLDYYFKHYAI